MTKLLERDTRLRDVLNDSHQAANNQDQALAYMVGRLDFDCDRPERATAFLYWASPEKLAQLRAREQAWKPTEIEVQVRPGLQQRLLAQPALRDAKLAQLRLHFRTDTDGAVSWILTDLRPLPPVGDAIVQDWINVQGQVLMVGHRTLVVRIHAQSVLPFTLRLFHDGDVRFEKRQRRWCFRLKFSGGKLRIHTAIPLGEPLPESWEPKPRRPKLRRKATAPAKAGRGPARPARPAVPAR